MRLPTPGAWQSGIGLHDCAHQLFATQLAQEAQGHLWADAADGHEFAEEIALMARAVQLGWPR